MTYNELISYYSNLLIKQYGNKPRAVAHINAISTELLCNNLPLTIQSSFDINTAVGKQLDTIGKYLGVNRVVNYNGTYILSDDEMRFIIKFFTIKNNGKSDYKTIIESVYSVFGDQVKVFDNGYMRLTYYILTEFATLIGLFITLGALPAPAGVSINPIIVFPHLDKIFSYRTYTNVATPGTVGYNSYTNYTTGNIFLSYSNAL